MKNKRKIFFEVVAILVLLGVMECGTSITYISGEAGNEYINTTNFHGIYDWTTTSNLYLKFNGTMLDFNDTLMNLTIDARITGGDSNASNCADGEYLDGSGLCVNFNDTADDRITAVDTNCSADMSCDNILYDSEVINVTVNKSLYWDDLDDSSDITILGTIITGLWEATAIVDADNLPPAIYIYLSRRGITWIEFNWTATDVSAHNTTIIYLVENDTGLIWENVTTGLTYTYKFDNLYNTTVYTVFVNETDIHGNSNETNLSVSTLTGKGTVPFTRSIWFQGPQKFQGLLWQFEMMIVGVAASISVLGILRPKVPVLGVVSGIYWMYAAIGSAKTIIYLSNGTSVYYLGGWYLIYLFGGFGLLMIVYALFNYLSNSQEVVNAMVSPDSMREY